MQKKILFLLFFFTTNFALSSFSSANITLQELPFKKSIKDYISEGNVFCESKVKSKIDNQKKWQTLEFNIAGLHKKDCRYALYTLSRYEDFKNYLSFIKKSDYDEKTQTLDFLISHLLLPYDMELTFKLPRIKNPGVYPFSFELGILNGLKGNIYVSNHNNRCLFYTKASWTGPDTGFNNSVFEMFSQGLAKISMEVLFRISSTLSH